jgi:hypothetical protein
MRILPKILITVFVLLGVAFAVMLSFSSCQNGPGLSGCGTLPFKFGVDANGCDSPAVEPFPKDSEVAAWLKEHGVSKECYKIRFWKHKHLEKEIGTLAAIQCITQKGAKYPGPGMTAPSGSGGTQRVMFNSPETLAAFQKYINGAKK